MREPRNLQGIGPLDRRASPPRRFTTLATVALGCAFGVVALRPSSGQDGGAAPNVAKANDVKSDAPPTLEETRVVLEKWIDTQKLLSKERNDWQQGKEILTSRIDLVKREIAALEEKVKQAESSVAETKAKREELQKQNDQLKATGAQLTKAVASLEGDVRKLVVQLPEPVQTRLKPLTARMPDEASAGRVTTGERFQNVLGILSEVNTKNNEIAVNYEVRDLADGKPAEVRVLYVGLAQAYYVSANGHAGVGRPGKDGWTWTPDDTVANDVLTALEIQQGKHSPAFVPLPVKLQ